MLSPILPVDLHAAHVCRKWYCYWQCQHIQSRSRPRWSWSWVDTLTLALSVSLSISLELVEIRASEITYPSNEWYRWENTTLISLIPSCMRETPNCDTMDSLRPAINTSLVHSENHGFPHTVTPPVGCQIRRLLMILQNID